LCGDATLPARPLFVAPGVDLAQRRLVALRGPVDASEFLESSLTIAAAVLGEMVGRVVSGRPQTQARRRRLVAEARLALHERPDLGLVELGALLAVSPYNLSRAFRLETGQTFSRFRNRLRVRFALERLAQGEESLTRLAAELGFADHAHLSRTVRTETGATQARMVRRRLTYPQGGGSLGISHGAALYVGSLIGPGVLLVPALALQAAGPASLIAWAALLHSLFHSR
jgi:AraC-like DNA-binding protein